MKSAMIKNWQILAMFPAPPPPYQETTVYWNSPANKHYTECWAKTDNYHLTIFTLSVGQKLTIII